MAKPDPAASRVGALAADASGRVWFESGATGEGLLTQIVGSTSVGVRRTGVKLPFPPPGGSPAPRASASTLAADHAGGVLIAGPSAVHRLAQGLETVAGTRSPAPGEKPELGDGGPLAAARFNRILAIASDNAGNVYVADEIDRKSSAVAIRFLNRSDRAQLFYAGTPRELSVAPGTVATIFGGRGGPKLIAEAPVLAATADRLYIGGSSPGASARAVVRVLNPGSKALSAHGVTIAPGAIATVATVRTPRGRDVTASPSASALPGLAADDSGNLYLAESANHRVVRVDGAGTSKTFAGTGAPGFNGNDRLATRARLNRPYDVEFGSEGRVYISDAGNARVRVVDQAGTIRSALGNGMSNRWVCGDPSEEATKSSGAPASLATDASGNVYVTVGLGRVYRLTPSGSVAAVVGRNRRACTDPAGCGAADNTPPHEAYLAESTTVATGPAGGIYVVEAARVRFLNLGSRSVRIHGATVPAGAMRTVTGFAETAESPPPSAPGTSIYTDPASGMTFSTPEIVVTPTIPDGGRARTRRPLVFYNAVNADRLSNLLVATAPFGPRFVGHGSVRQVDHRGIVTTLVGPAGQSHVDGSFDRKRCCALSADLATDAAGNLYIADSGGGRVWFLNRGPDPVVAHGVEVAPGVLAPVAGAVEAGSQDEGIRALDADLSYPTAIAVDANSNLYIADPGENAVERVDAQGAIMTVVGTGQPGFNGDGLKGTVTALDKPMDLLVDACANLLIADSGNSRVRRLNLAASCTVDGPAVAHDARRPVAAMVVGGVGLALVGGVLLIRRGHVRRPGEGRASAR